MKENIKKFNFSEILGIAPITKKDDEAAETIEKVSKKVSEEAEKLEKEAQETKASFIEKMKEKPNEAPQETTSEEDIVDEDINLDNDPEPTPEEIEEFEKLVNQASSDDKSEEESEEESKDHPSDEQSDDEQSEDESETVASAEEKPTETIEAIKQRHNAFVSEVLDSLKGIKPPVEEEEEPKMEDLSFYNNIPQYVYNYDNTGIMDIRLENYLKRTIAKDANLAYAFIDEYLLEFINKNPDTGLILVSAYLEDIIRANPDILPEIDAIAARVAEDSMNIKVGFERTVARDGKIYDTLQEGIADMSTELTEALAAINVEFQKTYEDYFEKIWIQVDKSGEEVRRLTEEEVRDYIANFRGDKDALRKTLKIEEKAPEKAKNPQNNKKQAQPKKEPKAPKGSKESKKAE